MGGAGIEISICGRVGGSDPVCGGDPHALLQEEAEGGEVTILRGADEVLYPLRLAGLGRAARGLDGTLAWTNRHFVTAFRRAVTTLGGENDNEHSILLAVRERARNERTQR